MANTPAHLEAQRRYRESHREELRAKSLEYSRRKYAEDPEKFRAKSREWLAADPVRAAEIRKRDYEKHAEKRRADRVARRDAEKENEYGRRHYAENAERLRTEARERRAANPEKALAATRRWFAQHPEKHNEYWQIKRARKRAAEGSFTRAEFRQRCAEHNDRCFYCGSKETLTADHVLPLSRGGSNWIDNIVGACRSCNSKKHNSTLAEFMDRMAA